MLEWASFYNGIAQGLAVLGYGFNAQKKSKLSKTKNNKNKHLKKQSRLLSTTSSILMNIKFLLCLEYSSTPAPIKIKYDELYGSNQLIPNSKHIVPSFSTDLFTTPRGIPQIRREQRDQLSHTQRNTDEVIFDWDWLCMNLKAHQELLPVQAGFLLAAGLTGHIRSINVFEIHEFLIKNEKFLAISIMLGLSVAHRGTSNVYKILTAFLPFLLPPTLCEFRIEPSIQTASIISLGFLFVETTNYDLVNKLINQMAREIFDNDQTAERYSNVLAAGFAVGLINLGKGRELDAMDIPVASQHLSTKERLVVLLNGGKRELCLVNYDRCVCPSTKVFLPGFTNIHTGNSQFNNEAPNETFNQQRANGTQVNNGVVGDGLRNSDASSRHVRELKTVNMHVTSAAACAALSLMFLKTEDKWITSKLEIPNTISEIERIRPDILMMRVLGKGLVNFDQIGVNREWMERQCPNSILKLAKEYPLKMEKSTVDIETVAQTYYYCMAGACFAIGLHYVSTCNLEAHSTIIMAGSGDLLTTQYLRKLRNTNRPKSFSMIAKEIDAHVHSLHVSTNMALGLLLSLSKSNIGIAGLFISFFPLYPVWLGDNRLYFQPLRFLWTLAVDSVEIHPPGRRKKM